MRIRIKRISCDRLALLNRAQCFLRVDAAGIAYIAEIQRRQRMHAKASIRHRPTVSSPFELPLLTLPDDWEVCVGKTGQHSPAGDPSCAPDERLLMPFSMRNADNEEVRFRDRLWSRKLRSTPSACW
jgi:hypothetical protein